MKVQVKKVIPQAIIPSYAKPGDAGLDLTAVRFERKGEYIEYNTGLAVAIPEGYVGLVFPRSSISDKDQHLVNSVGVIDSGYRGEIKVRMKRTVNRGPEFMRREYCEGERIAQLIIIPYPSIELQEVTELDETVRGTTGFGSSNKRDLTDGKAKPARRATSKGKGRKQKTTSTSTTAKKKIANGTDGD